MKQLIIILLLPLLFTASHISTFVQKESEIDILAEFLTENNLAIDEWNVMIKEKIKREDLQQLRTSLREAYDEKIEETENVTKYLFINPNKEEDISESYMVVVPKNESNNNIELNYKMEGKYWDKPIAKKQQLIRSEVLNAYFSLKADIYTCLITKNSGIMKHVDFFKEIQNTLHLQQISTQTDKIRPSIHNKTIYGYTNKWKEKIHINDAKINVQMTVQESNNEEMKIIIGTPILINEY